ncbi:RNA polymerase Rpo13 [Sulfolobus sp. F3]|nr:RNA polymerase Rpo13 [Sulfolobus sp. F3]
MPEDENEDEYREESSAGEGEEKVEEESEELPKLSIKDIELLMKNTQIWDDLLNGKISVDEAKLNFDQIFKEYEGGDSKKKTKRVPAKKVKKPKRKLKKRMRRVNYV